MKHLLIIPVFLFGFFATAQFDYGVVGGLNFHATGPLKTSISDVGNFRETAKRKAGYFAGVYGKVNVLAFYIRPEIHLNQLQSEYETFKLSTINLEAPVSFGYTIFPSTSLFAGPSFRYRLSEEIDLTFEDIQSKTSMGAHIGTRVSFGGIALELRYERGLNSREIEFLNENGIEGQFDSRGEKWILGISFSFK